MNKRIKELMTQVCIEQNLPVTLEHNSTYMLDAFAEKFALLIIRESVAVADDYVKDCTCEEHVNSKHRTSAIGRKIRDHFGD